MAGDVVEPRVDLGDESWSGDPDDLFPAVAEAIAIAQNARRPWGGSVDPDLPLRWADGIHTTRPSGGGGVRRVVGWRARPRRRPGDGAPVGLCPGSAWAGGSKPLAA